MYGIHVYTENTDVMGSYLRLRVLVTLQKIGIPMRASYIGHRSQVCLSATCTQKEGEHEHASKRKILLSSAKYYDGR